MRQTELDVYLQQLQFPGMPEPESNIARAWLRRHGIEYDRFDFNVRLGQGRPPAEGLTETTIRQNALLSQLRADVIGHSGDRVDLIEVKFRGDARALGQIRGYAHLWREAHPGIPVRNMIIVARLVDPDIRRIYEAEGVVYETIEPEGVVF